MIPEDQREDFADAHFMGEWPYSPWPLRIVLAVIALSVAGLLALAVWVVW